MDSKEKNKKINHIAISYILHCTDDDVSINGRMNNSFFAIRKFLSKLEQEKNINYLYDFCLTLTDKQKMSLSDFYKKADRWRVKQLDIAEKAKTKELKIQEKKEYSLDDLDNL